MEDQSTKCPPWKGYQKIGFRFALIFFVLFIILLDWSANPIFSYLYYYGHLADGLDILVSWTGKHLFDIPYTIVSPYDGEHNDRTYVYLLYFTMALTAIVGTIVWGLADRKRQDHDVLYYWFTTIVRYYLAFTMFLFGLYKFFRIQFPELGHYTLSGTVGDMSPMHLAWAFFGYSHGYNVFMGIAECAGLLLLFRRTTTLGSILTMGALSNIIAVNYNFDVHAKMYPTALFLMALFLLLKDAKRIIRFFFTGEAISLPVIKAPVFQKRWMDISKTVLKILVIVFFLFGHMKDSIGYKKGYQERSRAISGYSGIYDIDTFVLNGDTLTEDNPFRWQQLVIGDRILEAVRFRGDSIALASVDANEKDIIVFGDPTDYYTKRQGIYNELGNSDDTYRMMDSILVARQIVSSLNFELSGSTVLLLKGKIKNDPVYITTKKRDIDINGYRLKKSYFHWINEASHFY